MKAANESDYLPSNLEAKLRQARHNEVQSIQSTGNLVNKKRQLSGKQTHLDESMLLGKERFSSKRKYADMINEDGTVPEEIEKTVQELKEERFFQKEFAKDVKKIQDFNGGRGQARTKKNGDLVDKYIDGEVDLADFITQMETKLKDKKKGKGGRHGQQNLTVIHPTNTRRLSEFVGFDQKGGAEHSEEMKEQHTTKLVVSL
jgi:hypothetical protein